MSSRMNLNENVEEVFQFSIGGLDYDLRYPTLEEIEPITNLSRERNIKASEKTPESEKELIEIDDKLTEEFYKFIVPVGHETPIAETLRKQSFPVVRAFNKMITKQLTEE